jgi:hypothetical protein
MGLKRPGKFPEKFIPFRIIRGETFRQFRSPGHVGKGKPKGQGPPYHQEGQLNRDAAAIPSNQESPGIPAEPGLEAAPKPRLQEGRRLVTPGDIRGDDPPVSHQ